jgi:predicted transcriptional regulator
MLRLYDRYRRRRAGAPGSPDQDGEQFHFATDRMSDFLQEHANYFPTIEAAAERVRADIDHTSDIFDHGLRTYLFNVFGIEVRLASLPHHMARRLSPDGLRLQVSDILPPETSTFSSRTSSPRASRRRRSRPSSPSRGCRNRTRPVLVNNVLASYFAAALIMPYEPFLRAAARTATTSSGWAAVRASFEQVCHRLTTLQRPGAQGIPLHLVRTDIAGNISKRFSLSGIPSRATAAPARAGTSTRRS